MEHAAKITTQFARSNDGSILIDFGSDFNDDFNWICMARCDASP